jgi:hypothetical protein
MGGLGKRWCLMTRDRAHYFMAWCIEKKTEVVHIQPCRPMQNANSESFHGRLR